MQGLELIIVVALEGALSISLNASIVVINVINMRRGVKLSPSDLIHVTMGVINIVMRSLLLVQSIGVLISSSYMMESFCVMTVLIPFQMYLTYWLTAWLCAYYCVTITNASHRLCIWVKRCLTTFLPHLLLISGAGSLFISLLSIWTISFRSIVQYPGNSMNTTTTITQVMSNSLPYTILITFLGCLSPVLIIISSLWVTVSSLIQHVRNLQKTDSGFSLRSHINAIRTMILFLVLSVLYCVADFIVLTEDLQLLQTVISWFIITLFPTAEAVIIIQASSTLRKTLLQRVCARDMVED